MYKYIKYQGTVSNMCLIVTMVQPQFLKNNPEQLANVYSEGTKNHTDIITPYHSYNQQTNYVYDKWGVWPKNGYTVLACAVPAEREGKEGREREKIERGEGMLVVYKSKFLPL